MATFFRNVKFFFRSMAKAPAAAAVLIVTLALGIGVNSAMFSVMNAVLLRPLPYADPQRLVAISEAEKGGKGGIPVADGNLPDLLHRTHSFQAIAGYTAVPFAISNGGRALQAPVTYVNSGFFEVFKTQPFMGRTFSGEENRKGGPAVALISYQLWSSMYGSDPQILKRTISVDGASEPIVGVMPRGFEFPKGTRVWMSLDRYSIGNISIGASRTAHNYDVVARLADGVSLVQAQSELSTLAGNLAAAYPKELDSNFDFSAVSLHKDLAGDSRKTIFLLMAIVGVVLLIACVNMASVMLAKAVGRGKEMAIRRAVGADTRVLVAQLLTESGLIGLTGALAGLLLAYFSLSFLNSIVPARFLHSGPITLDWRVVSFTLLLGLGCGLIFGLLPALKSARLPTFPMLKTDGAPTTLGTRRRRLGDFLVTPQYALSLAALIIAALVLKSLFQLISVDPGYATRELITAQISLPTAQPSRYADREATMQFYRRLLERAQGLPGVHSATLDGSLPLSGQILNGAVYPEGTPLESGHFKYYPDWRVVGPDYFKTFSVAVLQGRDFGNQDGLDSIPVAIVNQSLARRIWGNDNPIGKRLVVPIDFTRQENTRLLTVVGVVPDVRERSLDKPPRAAVYVPFTQHPVRASDLTLVLSVGARPESYAGTVRTLIHDLSSEVPVEHVQSMTAWVQESTSQSRFLAGLLSGFGALALLLALLGTYGVMSYSISERRQEMAIRMSMGAGQKDLLRLLMGEGLRIVVIGQVLGVGVALLLEPLLSDLLFAENPFDLPMLAAASLLLAVVVLMTCLIPARRAGRVDPVRVLRA